MAVSLASAGVSIAPHVMTDENVVTFRADANGLILLAEVSKTEKSIDAITLTLKLVNHTGKDLTFLCMASPFPSMRFSLKDASGAIVPFTKEAGSCITNSIPSFEYWSETVKDGSALVRSCQLTEYVQIQHAGKYTLYARWREEKLGMVYSEDITDAKLHLAGRFLIQNIEGGVSVSPAN